MRTVQEKAFAIRDHLRVLAAYNNCRGQLERIFREAQVPFPPRRLFLRAFKHEAVLELWAAADVHRAMVLISTYSIRTIPGKLGPKREHGDMQIPEGVYRVNRLNPESLYHLSFSIDYPNESDRVHADPVAPGDNIFVHGGSISRGCLAIGDDAVEQLFSTVHAALLESPNQPVNVHLFPCRLVGQDLTSLVNLVSARDLDKHRRFWLTLKTIYEAFGQSHVVPNVGMTHDSFYEAVPTYEVPLFM